MSSGAGAIERAIERLVKDAAPAATFTVTEICRRVYGYPEVVSRQQTVSVRRALCNVLKRSPEGVEHLSRGKFGLRRQLCHREPCSILASIDGIHTWP